MKILCILTLISLQFLNATPTEVECFYSNNHYDVVGTIYQCKVNNAISILSKEQSTITSVSQDHLSYKNNDDVIGYVSVNNYIKYFPQGLENIFKNLQLIHIKFTYIEELSQSDMKPFPELKELDLHDNEIKVLEDGLFAFNPKLEFISLSNNKIAHIGLTVFDGLNNLEYLYLTFNMCIDKGAYLSRSEVLNVIEYAKVECSSSEYMNLLEELKELENEATDLEPEKLQDRLAKIEVELTSSSFSESSALNERLEKLKKTEAVEMLAKKGLDLAIPVQIGNKRNTFNIIFILMAVLSVVLIGGIVILFIKRK